MNPCSRPRKNVEVFFRRLLGRSSTAGAVNAGKPSDTSGEPSGVMDRLGRGRSVVVGVRSTNIVVLGGVE